MLPTQYQYGAHHGVSNEMHPFYLPRWVDKRVGWEKLRSRGGLTTKILESFTEGFNFHFPISMEGSNFHEKLRFCFD